MGVRPPRNESGEGPESIEFGIAALDARLDDERLKFPASAADLASQYGDQSIPVDAAGNKMILSRALEECERDSFDSRRDLLNALHPVFEAERQRRAGSLVGRLRSLVPF